MWDVGAEKGSVISSMNQRGFMLLSTVFLTLILSFTAMLTLQAMTRVKNGDQSLKLHAINLANEQLAIIESGSNIEIPADDLKSYGLYEKNSEKPPVEFQVTTNINSVNENLREVEVIVTWNDAKVKFKKLVRIAGGE